MSSQPRKPFAVLTALLAVLAILLGPIAAASNCCCSPATAADNACPVAAEPDRESSCSGGGCCEHTATQRMLPADGSLPGSAACACQGACCDTSVGEATAVLIQPSLQRDISVGAVALPDARFDLAARDRFSSAYELRREPAFLSSPARCAMLCRWLN